MELPEAIEDLNWSAIKVRVAFDEFVEALNDMTLYEYYGDDED